MHNEKDKQMNKISIEESVSLYGSGHGSVAVLLPGFAINW